MSLEYTYDEAPLAQDIAPSGINITSRADQGDPAFGGVPIQDPAAGLDSVGHRPFYVEESACSQPRLFTGWVTQRDMSRSEERAQLVEGARLHDMTIVDLNALFNFRHIRGSEGKRPAETWTERRDWIIGSPFLAGLIEDTGYVGDLLVERDMDETDYRGQYPSAVFADLVERTGDRINFFAFWDPAGGSGGDGAVSLFVGHLTDSTGDSPLAISNVLTDVSDTIFAPSVDAVLSREPDSVYSEVTLVWANGRVFRRRQSTESTYIRRGIQIDRPYCKSASRAQELAEAYLDRHDSETDRITVKILVPAESAGLAMAGQRIEVKFSHLPGYETWTWMRIAQSTPTPTTDVADFYEIALELVMPQSGGAPPAGCPDSTVTGTYPRLGSATSDEFGNVIYWRPGISYPEVPTPYHVGSWHFPAYGTVSCSILADWAGDCSENRVRFIVVGAGVATIVTTDNYGCTGSHNLVATLEHNDGSGPVVDETQNGPAGIDFVFTVPSDGFCTHWIDVTDDGDCGSKWGFLRAEWVLGEVDEEEDLGSSQTQTVEATRDPTVTDDATEGYIPGQVWVNTDTGQAWVLTDATAGAAVWLALAGGSLALDDLTDVNAPSPADGEVLTWDDYWGEWVPGVGAGAIALDDLTDVNTYGVGDGDVLTYDDYLGEWLPAAGGGGLSDQGAFTYLDATEGAAPSTPSSGYARIYAKSDGRIYSKDDGGIEYGPFDEAGAGLPIEPPFDIWGTYPYYTGATALIWTTGAVNTADKALYIPVVFPEAVTAVKMWYVTGGTTNNAANIDLGVYDTSGTRLVSTGSTAYNQNNNSTFTVIDIADTVLPAGLYYLALVCSSTNSGTQFMRWDMGTVGFAPSGSLVEASALPLPDPATWAIPTTESFLPMFGILARSEIS